MAEDGVVHLRTVPPVRIEPDGAVLEAYIASRAPVKIVQGPVGSGKSTASWHALMLNALSRQPASTGGMGLRKGVRYRRTLVLRNTLKQIKDTVLPTKALVMPAHVWGEPTQSGRPRHHIRMPGVDWEILFYGLDDPVASLEDLKSLEVSDVYVSEARYMAREILVAAFERAGRYPPIAAGGCVEPQMLGDTNAPEVGSWLSIISGQSPMPEGLGLEDRLAFQKPEGWEYFLQPAAVVEVRDVAGEVTGYEPNPAAENLAYLPGGIDYYAKKIGGRTRGEIETELGNKPGAKRAGKPVWPGFRREVHARSGLEPVAGHPLLVGVDFGRTPAAAIGQHVFGAWRVLRETTTDNMAAREFARLLKASLAQWFPDMDWACWGDPAGEDLEQSDDTSPFLIMRAEGVRVLPAPTGPVRNDWTVRKNAVADLFERMVDGRPAFLVDLGACPVLTAGLDGQYAYPRMHTGDERYGDRPLKNRFSHVADALQYMVLGGGEGRVLFQRTAMGRAVAPARMVRAQTWRGRGWGARR